MMCDSDSGLSISMNGSQNDSPGQGMVFIRITFPEEKVENTFTFSPNELIMDVKMTVINSIQLPLKDKWNYGLFLPPSKGKAGKFLQEERMLKDYPFESSIGHLELKYKQRVYRVLRTNLNKLRKLNSKANFRQFMDIVKSGDVDKVSKWLNKGLDPNFQLKSSGETPLTLSVQAEKPKEIIMALVAGGAHLDYRAADSMTPLHRAAAIGNYEAIKVLLDLGQSPNTRDQFDLTPLYHAVLNNTIALCVERLLFDHSILGVADEAGLQEIHQACRFGRVQHLEVLIAYGADINVVTSKNGNTPLHICAYTGQESCARLLLFRGADRSILNRVGHTAYQQAVLAEYNTIAELIKDFQEKDVVPYRGTPKRNERRRSASTIRSHQRCSSMGRLSDYPRSRGKLNMETGNNMANSDQRHSDTVKPNSNSKWMTSSVSGYCLNSMLSETKESCNFRGAPELRNGTHNSNPNEFPMTRSAFHLNTSFNSLVQKYNQNVDQDYSVHAATMRLPRHQNRNKSYTGTESGKQNQRSCLDPNWGMMENGSDTASIFSTSSSVRGHQPTGSIDSSNTVLHMLLNGNGSLLDFDASNLPRMIALQRGPQGFGFVVRGKRGIPNEFQPSIEIPASQYLEKVEPESAASRAGLKPGDFILEVNGINVTTMSHEAVVDLIRGSGDVLGMKVITVDRRSIAVQDQLDCERMSSSSISLSSQRLTNIDRSVRDMCPSSCSNWSTSTLRNHEHKSNNGLSNNSSKLYNSNGPPTTITLNGTNFRSDSLGEHKAETPTPMYNSPSNSWPQPPTVLSDEASYKEIIVSESNFNQVIGKSSNHTRNYHQTANGDSRKESTNHFSVTPTSTPTSEIQRNMPITHPPPPPPPPNVPASPTQPKLLPPPLAPTQNNFHPNKSNQPVSILKKISTREVPMCNQSSDLPTMNLDEDDSSEMPLPLPPPPILDDNFNTLKSANKNSNFSQDTGTLKHGSFLQNVLRQMDQVEKPRENEIKPSLSFDDHLRQALARRRRMIEMASSEVDADDDQKSVTEFNSFSKPVSNKLITNSNNSNNHHSSTVEYSSEQNHNQPFKSTTLSRQTSLSRTGESSFKTAAEKLHSQAMARQMGSSSTIPPPDKFRDNGTLSKINGLTRGSLQTFKTSLTNGETQKSNVNDHNQTSMTNGKSLYFPAQMSNQNGSVPMNGKTNNSTISKPPSMSNAKAIPPPPPMKPIPPPPPKLPFNSASKVLSTTR